MLKLVDIEGAAGDLKPIEVGTSSTVRVGMGALAIGKLQHVFSLVICGK